MTQVTPGKPAAPSKSMSQTLDRGIRVLEVLAAADDPATVAELAALVDVDRTILYRLLRTLAAHRLVTRDSRGNISLGTGLLALSMHLSSQLQTASRPELTSLASDTGATAFLTIEDDGDAVCLDSVEPRNSLVHVAYRAGLRHPLDQGASSAALLLGGPHVVDERPEITRARSVGYAISRGEVQPGTLAVAAPISSRDGDVVASVGIVTLAGVLDPELSAPRIVAAAERIARALA